jgi:peroxiredoxin
LQSITARINAEKVVAIGNPFVDIAAPAPNGDTLRLSDYAAKGKYTLVVFWASWCHYCQQEIPVVVELFNQYKDKDFNIFTISGDTDAAAWTNKIEEANMTFANVSELRGFESGSFKTYYIQSIPQMVLLDKEGKIIAKGNLSSGVKTKIEEALKGAE